MMNIHTHSHGLTSAEAAELLRKNGPNSIPVKRVGVIRMLVRQFKSAIVILLLIAAAISWAVADHSGATVILAIIVFNAFIGFVQEYKAEKKLYEVSTLVQPTAVVKRDGKLQTIPRERVVVGDLVQISAGAIAPADMELIFAEGLTVDESSLTGESLPVPKDAEKNKLVEMGSVVAQGVGEGTVTAVGVDALLGQIVNLAETGRPTNFEKEIRKLSELCIGIIVLTTVGLFVGKLIVHPASALSIEFLIFVLAIAIGILPETLPLVATVALSTGALMLSKLGVVVRNLGAIRDFGSVSVLCSDKTGTLTENALTVSSHFAIHEESFATIVAVSAGIKGDVTDPFQHALAAMQTSPSTSKVEFVRTVPFNAETRQAAFAVHIGGKPVIVHQGAYEVVAKLANHVDGAKYEQWILEHESKGERILAFSLGADDKQQMAALVSFVDPVRQSAMHAIATARKLGVSIKMISGDSDLVCRSVGHRLKLIGENDRVVTGAQWKAFTDEQKEQSMKNDTIFARFFPVQKYELIKLLQANGEVVGYMGDGVNDAPSLKLADVGIAVSNASDIAKSSADIILMKPGLDVVIRGIKQGRAIFENVSKYLRETLTENLGNFLSISVLSLFLPYLPMLPIQILVTNLITDFPHLAIATDSVDAESLKAPKRLKLKSLIRFMIVLSFISSGADLVYFAVFRHLEPSVVQSGWFVVSSMAEIASLLSVRSRGFFFQTTRPAPFLALTSFSVVAFVLAAVTLAPLREVLKLVALPHAVLFGGIGIVLCYFLLFDVVKRWPETY